MRGKKVSKTHWERIIGAYLSGIRQRVISTQFGIPTSTVNDIIKKYKKTGSTEPKKHFGRPKVLTELRSYLHSEGLRNYTVRKKPHLTAKHRTDRLRWYGRAKVWRSSGETYNKDCIQPTVKFGGGSVIFWGCFGWHGVGLLVVVEGNMNSDEYVNILANHFIPWVDNYPNSIFQQDRVSCYTSTYSVWWMRTGP
ncbi:unnamed protein product [Rhizophagus irregularis]|nr:unnamed protein product [Rhizophagus irregularis]CAB5393285.1 unnamed protein product [Rhizophagus irregularis]